MGGCATKPRKLQTPGASMENEVVEVVGVVKKVVEVETKEIEVGRKSLRLLFMENKKEKMKDDKEEATEFDVSLEAQNAPEELELVHPPAATQEQKNATVTGN